MNFDHFKFNVKVFNTSVPGSVNGIIITHLYQEGVFEIRSIKWCMLGVIDKSIKSN